MGIVRRQSALNLIWSYLGVGLGYVNKVILFAEILSKSQFGLLELLLTFMTVGTELALLGSPKIITRFFPHHRNHPFREGSLMFFLAVYSLAGFLLLALALLLFQPWLVGAYQENSPLFVGAYGYVLPITLAYMLYRVLGGISASLFRSVIPTMAFEVALKLVVTALILVYWAGWMSFDALVLSYVLAHFIPALIVLADLLRHHLKWKVDWQIFRSRSGRLMIQYGLYSTLSDATAILVQRMDILVVALLIGEMEAGTFAIAAYFGSLIVKSSRSTNVILGPLIATRLKERKMDEVAMLYRKTALNDLLIGGFFLIMMTVNIGPFFDWLPKHGGAKFPAMILGLALLLNMFTGPHRLLILNSRLFRFDLYANIVMLMLATALDFWLVAAMGMIGAALATLLVTVLYNVVMMLFVQRKMGLLPISWKNFLWLACLLLIAGAGLAVPDMAHPVFTMAARTTVAGLLYALLVLGLRPSPDLLGLVQLGLAKLRGRRAD